MICENIKCINDTIEFLKDRLGIKYPVELLAVSKTYPVEAILEAYDGGQMLFGENRVQEAYAKFSSKELSDKSLLLHIIGHLQRNKVKEAVKIASMIQSVDKMETLHEIEKQCGKIDKKIDYLIEVNTSGEDTKSGIAPDGVLHLLDEIRISDFKYCNLRGFMTVGPLTDDVEKIRASFRLLKSIFDKISQDIKKSDFDTLSMGMSGDYKIAIEEGSTLVRVGSAIFGRRSYN